jgi:hypothetical protein
MPGRQSHAADTPRYREARDEEGGHPALYGKPGKCERPNCQSADDRADDDGEKWIGTTEIPVRYNLYGINIYDATKR